MRYGSWPERKSDMASIEKRADGRWRARWREYPAGPQTTKHFDRKGDAERFLVEVEHGLLVGTYTDPGAGKVTVAEYAQRWTAAQTWRPSTGDRVQSVLDNHVLPKFGARPLSSLRPTELQAWVNGLRLAPSTKAGALTLFASLLKAAVRDRLIPISPADQVKAPKGERRLIVPLTTGEVGRLSDMIRPDLRAAVILAAGTGMREGEVLGLTVDRVAFLRREIRIDRQLLTPTRGVPVLAPPKTAAAVRVVPMADVVSEALAGHLAQVPADPDGLVFTRAGEPWRRSRFIEEWGRARSTAALPSARFHDLRHHAASLLISAGVSVRGVQEMLGHASATETLEVYSHLWPTDHERIRAAIQGAFVAPEMPSAQAAEDQLRTERVLP
jgi:integrase